MVTIHTDGILPPSFGAGLVVNLGEFSEVQMGVTFSCAETRVAKSSWTLRISAPASRRCVAKEWRREWGKLPGEVRPGDKDFLSSAPPGGGSGGRRGRLRAHHGRHNGSARAWRLGRPGV